MNKMSTTTVEKTMFEEISKKIDQWAPHAAEVVKSYIDLVRHFKVKKTNLSIAKRAINTGTHPKLLNARRMGIVDQESFKIIERLPVDLQAQFIELAGKHLPSLKPKNINELCKILLEKPKEKAEFIAYLQSCVANKKEENEIEEEIEKIKLVLDEIMRFGKNDEFKKEVLKKSIEQFLTSYAVLTVDDETAETVRKIRKLVREKL